MMPQMHTVSICANAWVGGLEPCFVGSSRPPHLCSPSSHQINIFCRSLYMGIPGLLHWLWHRNLCSVRSDKLHELLSGNRRTFVVDHSNFAYHAYQTLRGHTDFLCGGQWGALYHVLESLVQQVQGMRARLVFCCDAVAPSQKLEVFAVPFQLHKLQHFFSDVANF